MHRYLPLIYCLLCLTCGCAPRSAAYREFYAHLPAPLPTECIPCDSPYFLTIYVNARHLDYTDNVSFFKTVAKHPDDANKNGDVGHAWVLISGKNSRLIGGHTGETGLIQPRYFDGVMEALECGDPNPAAYFWAVQQDGYFQQGSGGHKATFAAGKPISEEQYNAIMRYIRTYPYQEYAITGNQCCTFAAEIAALAGVELAYLLEVPLSQSCIFRGCRIRLWTDPEYATLVIGSPDLLEKSLIEAVRAGLLTVQPLVPIN